MKTFRFLKLATVLFCLTACTQCKDEPDTVSVSPNSLEFEAKVNTDDPEQKKVSVTTNVKAWEVFNSSDWIKAEKTDDKTLSVSVINTWTNTREGRDAKILVKAGTVSDTVLVRQNAKIKDRLSLSTPSLSYAAGETGEKPVDVTTNSPSWNAVKSDNATWLNIEQDGKTLKVKVPSANTQTTPREATITFSGGDADAVKLTVTQGAADPYLRVSPTTLGFGTEETASKTVTVSTNVSWSAEEPASWVHLTKSGNTLTVRVDKNTGPLRDANIVLVAGGLTATVKVTQAAAAPTLAVTPASLSIGADDTAEKTLALTTNQSSWTATKSSTATWLTVTPVSGSSSTGTIRVTAAKNTSTSQRSATITVSAGTAPSVTVTVTQAGVGPYLTVTPSSLTIADDDTGQKTLALTTNQSSWAATKSSGATWLTVTPASGSTGTIRVSATRNTGAERSATITFTAGTATAVTVKVTQTAAAPQPDKPCFGDMPAGSYYATGTPRLAEPPGSSSWTGSVTLGCTNLFYSISNWAGTGITVYCDYKNDKIIMDSEFKYTVNTAINAYFMAIVINTANSTWAQLENYEARYNTSTRKLDFSGTYSGLPVIVGLIAIETATDKLVGVIGEAHSNTVLTLTPTSSSAPPAGHGVLKSEAVKQQGSLKVTPFEGNQVFKKAGK